MSAIIDKAVEKLSAKLSGGFDGVAKFVIKGEGAIMLDGTAGNPLDRSYTHRFPPLVPL